VVPELDEVPEAVRRECAFAATLGLGLLGALAGVAAFGAAGGLSMLLCFGACGTYAVDPRRHPLTLAGMLLVVSTLGFAVGASSLPRFPLAVPMLFAPGAFVLLLALLPLLGPMRALLESGAHEDGDVARMLGARWLLALSALGGLGAAGLQEIPLAAASIVVALFAAVRWALARDALTSRRRWLDHVRREDFAAWRIVPKASVDRVEALAPLLRATPLDGVLIRSGAGGPYRGGVGGAPVALVPRDAPRDAPVLWAVRWRAVGAAFAALGGLSVLVAAASVLLRLT